MSKAKCDSMSYWYKSNTTLLSSDSISVPWYPHSIQVYWTASLYPLWNCKITNSHTVYRGQEHTNVWAREELCVTGWITTSRRQMPCHTLSRISPAFFSLPFRTCIFLHLLFLSLADSDTYSTLEICDRNPENAHKTHIWHDFNKACSFVLTPRYFPSPLLRPCCTHLIRCAWREEVRRLLWQPER